MSIKIRPAASTLARMSWWEYVERITGGDNPTEISQRVDQYIADHPDEPLEPVSHQAIRRWRAIPTARPTSPMVRSIARAYGASMPEAMIAAGFFTQDDLAEQDPAQSKDPLTRMMSALWTTLDHPKRILIVELMKELSRRNKP